MTALLEKIWSASLYGGVIIGVILLLRLVLKGAPRKYICLLWLLAAVRLLVPFELESSFSLQPRVESLQQDTTVQVSQWGIPAGDAAVKPEGTNADIVTDVPSAPADTPSAVTPETDVQPEVGGGPNWTALITCIWLTVVLGLALYSMGSYWRLKRSVRGAVILSEGVWLCPEQNTAFVLGFLRPQIYLPAGLTEQERRLVLLHERAHISRGDPWWKLLGFGVLALHWFNPLVWVGYLLLCKDLEMACDEAVVRGMDVQERKIYSAALLSCAAKRPGIAACPVAFGEVSVKARIKNVLNYRKPIFWVTVVAVIAVVFVAVCFLTSPKDITQAPDSDTSTEATGPDTSSEGSKEWGITLYASNVTKQELTLVCEQDGTPVNGTLGTGSYFWLEQWTGSGWTPVEEIPPEDGVERVWTDDLWLITMDGTTKWGATWNGLYGELSPGTYRIGKIISLTSDETEGQPAETQTAKIYAQFTAVNGLTRGTAIEMCTEAYMELTEEFCFGVYEERYSDGTKTGTYIWAQGSNFCKQTLYDVLKYNGETFYRFPPNYAQQNGVKSGWVTMDYVKENQVENLWAGWLPPLWRQWDRPDWEMECISWERLSDGLACEFMDKDSQEVSWQFKLNADGKLERITMKTDGKVTVVYTILSYDPEYVENYLAEQYKDAVAACGPTSDNESGLRHTETIGGYTVSFLLPKEWAGQYILEKDGDHIRVCHSASKEDGGILFTLSWQEGDGYLQFPDSCFAVAKAGELTLVLGTPTDVQFGPDTLETYCAMAEQIPDILTTFTVQ